jgi:manganese/zinc/iron transport system substrate-binding protein
MVADAVKNVGGEYVEVTALMGPGVDPHLYKATAGDNARLAGADMVFYNGLLLEGKMTEVLEALAEKGKPVRAVADRIDKKLLLQPPGFEGHYDPHIWFDVRLWIQAVEAVREGLCDFDSAHAADYRRAAMEYLAELKVLHEWCKHRAGELSKEKRVLITSHDAYNYFGRAYGFEVIGVQGISTEEQATSRGIVDLSNLIRQRKVKAIFTESSVSPKAIQAIVANCRNAGWQVEEGGKIFSDAMDEPGKPAGSYIGMVQHNMNTIVNALK